MFQRSKLKNLAISTIALAVFSGGAVMAQNSKPWAPSTPPLPMDIIAKDWPLRGVTISPDGNHIAGIAGKENGNPVVYVWDANDLSKTPVAIGSQKMRFTSVSFVKNDRLWISANQPVSRGADSNWRGTSILSDLTGSKMETPLTDTGNTARVGLFGRLASDKDNIILTYGSNDGTLDLIKYNVRNGDKSTIARLSEDEDTVMVDRHGKLRIKSELKFEGGKYMVYYYYLDNNGQWVKQLPLTQDIEKRPQFDFIKLNHDATKAWVSTDKDSNYTKIRIYDFATQTMSAPVFENTDFNASDVLFWTDKGSEDESEGEVDAALGDIVAGYCWSGPSRECQIIEPKLKSLQSMMEGQFPNASVTISPRQKGNRTLVRVTNVNQPDTWYLFKDQRELVKIGSTMEGYDPRHLGTGQWVDIPARDGNKIPSVVILPPGYNKERDGRIPLVVLPHGGPWSRDDMDYDISHWPQMFATRGFAVIQPNYRGSTDLGRKLWLDGDKQWGAKMQDDNDDTAKWLVEQGIADPNRMMLYGYSYGGFAASAAAARSGGASKGLWQCAISGAPVIDIDRLRLNEWGEGRLQRKYQGQTVAGFNPQRHLDEIEIPWLIFHGDYDRQADTDYSRVAARAMSGKPNFKYVEIPKMAHQLIQMYPEHRRYFTSVMFDFMANNCGNISTHFKDSEASRVARAPFKAPK